MALANTTLASAMAANDSIAVLASSTGIGARDKMEIDGEVLQIIQSYTTAGNGVNVPVLRGQNGGIASAHPSGALVRIGPASDAEWGAQAPQTVVQFPIASPARQRASYTAAGAITLPNPGNDMVAFINGTSALAMTVAAPQTALDTSLLWVASNGVANHTVQFTGGLSGAGGSYDIITINSSAPVLLGPFMAVNGLWQLGVGVAVAGTVTNITGTIA